MTDKIKEQIIAIRESGLTNMFDIREVKRLAKERRFFELIDYIEDYQDRYVAFIFNSNKNKP
ncbi:MAG: DUF5049 domain-containing protein [Clostridia bacterium]|nr:DUF5049 domain-containing protein [Clostridia bacterium]